MRRPKPVCLDPECEKPADVRGSCMQHYSRLQHLVARGEVTWMELEEAGLALAKRKHSPLHRPAAARVATRQPRGTFANALRRKLGLRLP